MTTSLAVQPQQNANGIGELMQTAPQPQGLTPTVVPLDRDTLAFYGNMIVAAGLVPITGNISQEVAKFRCMAKIVAGVSYGFDPVLSQQCFDIMFNSLQPNARCMEILFKDSGEYDWREEYLNETGCKLKILKRVGGDWDASRGQYIGGTWTVIGIVEYTYAMAVTAKLPEKNEKWKLHPADMCFARCITRAVKRCNPGCMRPRTLLGNYFAKAPLAPPVDPAPKELDLDLPTAAETPAAADVTTGEAHIDPPFIDDSEGPEAEFSGMPEADEADSEPAERSEESILADLHTAISDRAQEIGIDRYEEILNGRKTMSMDKKALTLFLKELNK